MRRHHQIADEIEDSLQNEDDDDSSYKPSGEENDSDNSINSTSLPTKKAGLGKRKRKPASDKSETAAISQSACNAEATSQPSPKRTKQSDAADQQQEAQPERSSTSPTGKQTPKAMASKTGKRQHHPKRPGLGKQKPASDKSQTATISQSVSNAEATSQPSPKGTEQSDATDQQQEAHPERSSTSPTGKQTPKATASKTGKRQHHAKCP